MSNKLTEILGTDGEKIYIQYDDEESDELQAVGYIDDIRDRLGSGRSAQCDRTSVG
jgi:hypothetical protein